jgi:hypothetical protein
MNQLRPLIVILVLLAALAYLGGIAWAGIASLGTEAEPTIPEVVTQAITVIGGALATHFGAIFGISQFTTGKPRSLSSAVNFNSWTRMPLRNGEKESRLSWLQVVAAYLYVFSLVAAVIFWGLDGFSGQSARVLSNMSFTLVGVLAGVLAVALNVREQVEE